MYDLNRMILHSPTSRSARALFCCTLILAAVVVLNATAQARPPSRTLGDQIGGALLLSPEHWPWIMAKQFAESLPLRLARPLSGQTPKTIGAFVVQTSVPWLQPRHDSAWICVASCGSGGSFVALMIREGTDYTLVWDTLLPPSITHLDIDRIDLDDDGIPEVVYGGRILNSRDREWALLSWRKQQVNVLAPRLDVASEHVRDNRLIGDSLTVADSRDGGFRRVMIWKNHPERNWVMLSGDPASLRTEFTYRDSLDGYLPKRTSVR